MTTQQFNVPGISCQHCVKAITDEVTTIDGVQNVQVDLNSKQVKVDAADSVTREQLVAAIEEAGYDVSPYGDTIALS